MEEVLVRGTQIAGVVLDAWTSRVGEREAWQAGNQVSGHALQPRLIACGAGKGTSEAVGEMDSTQQGEHGDEAQFGHGWNVDYPHCEDGLCNPGCLPPLEGRRHSSITTHFGRL